MSTGHLLQILASAGVALAAAVIYYFYRQVARNAGGGWTPLLGLYSAGAPPRDCRLLAHRTIQVGIVILKRCATLGPGPEGLYLHAPMRRPVLIPWRDVHSVDRTRLRRRRAFRLSVGQPLAARLTLLAEDFEALRDYLPESLLTRNKKLSENGFSAHVLFRVASTWPMLWRRRYHSRPHASWIRPR